MTDRHILTNEQIYEAALIEISTYFNGNPLKWPKSSDACAQLVEIADKALNAGEANVHEPGVVYRKWPGEPPHCMSCDCGMTEEQKRTVPLDDYLRIHRQLIDLKYPGTAWDPNRCVVCGGNHGNLPCPQMTVTCG